MCSLIIVWDQIIELIRRFCQLLMSRTRLTRLIEPFLLGPRIAYLSILNLTFFNLVVGGSPNSAYV